MSVTVFMKFMVRGGSIEIIIDRKMKTSYSTTHSRKFSVNVKMNSIKTKNVLKENNFEAF